MLNAHSHIIARLYRHCLGGTTHRNSRGRSVVGHHALEIELEVAIAAVDHLDPWQNEVGRGQHRRYLAAGPAEGVSRYKHDFRFDSRMN